MLKQFVLPFGESSDSDPAKFIVAPCNAQAFGFVLRWPDWPASAAAIFGPPACGKSHLANLWKQRAGASVISAQDYSGGSAISTALVIEDMDAVVADPSRDHVLIEAFDTPGRSLLLTGRSPPSQWPAAAGDWKSRLQSVIAFEILPPDDDFLSVLIERQFANRQLRVPPSLITRILTHVERTPNAVLRFVEAADLKALSEKRAVSLRLVTEILDEPDSDSSAALHNSSMGVPP